jgi:hypothetical protein
MKHDRKALQDSMEINNAKLQNDLRTEIEMSFKRSELEIQRRHREILDRLRSKTSK